MKALVTGAAGFIGAQVLAALRSGGAEVRGFDRQAPAEAPSLADFVIGDSSRPATEALIAAARAASPDGARRSAATLAA